jgi:hypothetical protein
MTEHLNKMEWKQFKLLLGYKKLALYYAWGGEYYKNPKKAGKLNPPRMLDSEYVKHCGLITMYLVTCNKDNMLSGTVLEPKGVREPECTYQCKLACWTQDVTTPSRVSSIRDAQV